MTGHAIRGGRAVCLEPETSLCRARWDCDCEVLRVIERDGDAWTHVVTEWGPPFADEVHRSSGAYPAAACNIVSWLETDSIWGTWEAWYIGGYALDPYDPARDLELPDGAIRFTWHDEWASWEYMDPRVLGRAIALVVVGRWAEDVL